jgi:predicted amidohydrolase
MTDRPERPDRRAVLKLFSAGAAVAATGAAAREADAAATRVGAVKQEAPADTGRGYYACALQMRCDAVNQDGTRDAARARMRASLERIDSQIFGAKRWVGRDLALVVLPEYFLTGFPWGESIAEWADKAALALDGPEYDAIAAIASKHELFLAGNAYEVDPNFPGLYFQASFVFAPSGDLVLRYRRLVSLFAPTPHDVWDRYLDLYGIEGVFPVAETRIGRLAAIASEEILYPEIARCQVMRGAEVLLHCSSEAYTTTMPPKRIARLARAVENLAYVVSTNTAGVAGVDIPVDSANGGSEIIDYLGNTLVAAGQGETITAYARLDLVGLREYRRRPGMANLLSRQPFDLYASSYTSADFRRRNGLWKNGEVVMPDRSYFRERQAETIARLTDAGVL